MLSNIPHVNFRSVDVRNTPSVQTEPQIHSISPLQEARSRACTWLLSPCGSREREPRFPCFILSSTNPSYVRDIKKIPGIKVHLSLRGGGHLREVYRSVHTGDGASSPLPLEPFPLSVLIPLATASPQLIYKSQPPPEEALEAFKAPSG